MTYSKLDKYSRTAWAEHQGQKSLRRKDFRMDLFYEAGECII